MWRRRQGIVVAMAIVIVSGLFARDLTPLPDDNAGKSIGKGNPMFKKVSVRYQITDVERAVRFYTETLGFALEFQAGPAFASVSGGGIILWLSGPQSSGSRPMPDGRTQSPGGWNRIALEVEDLEACIGTLKKTGVQFRNDMESGPGGKQIQIEDPDGNPIELFEPAPRPAA